MLVAMRMTKTCQNCFYENQDGREKCDVCGSALSSDLPSGKSPEISASNTVHSLKRIRKGYLLFVLSFVLAILTEAILLRTLNYSAFLGPFSSISTTGSTASVTSSMIDDIAIDVLIPGVVTLIGYFLIYSGFKGILKLRVGIGTGRTGALLTAIGLILIYAGLIPLLTQLGVLTSPGATINDLVPLFASVVLLLVGAILILIGVIMLAIGLYRVGESFTNGTLKVGAVVSIFLGVIGYILVLIGLQSMINRLRSTENKQGETPPN